MAMNGIDVSGWQKGIDLAAVPADFVIAKATQGTSFVSDDYYRQMDQAIATGKKVGCYHYIGGQGAEAEMSHFVEHFNKYKGRAIPCLDWEGEQNSKWGNEAYLEQCIKVFVQKTGIPPIVYASLSAFPWGVCSRNNCGTWVAQYADMNPTGYQDSPWNEGKYSCTIRQYASTGRLSGYSGNLDINKAYIDGAAWDKYANPDGSVTAAPAPVGTDGKSISQLADEVIAGVYGNGDARKAALGDKYDAVQAEVNSRYTQKSTSQLADEVLAGKHGNGEERKASLGSRYDEVQAEVNRRLGANNIDDLARRVIAGEFGNGDQRRQKLGSLYSQVQKRVNEMLG